MRFVIGSELWKGDTLRLEAGRVFEVTTPLLFPNLPNGSGKTVITSTELARLPELNTRITHAYTPLMPEIRLIGNTVSAVEFESGPVPAEGYSFIGVRFGIASNIRTHNRGLVRIGTSALNTSFVADPTSDRLIPTLESGYHKAFLRFDQYTDIPPLFDYTHSPRTWTPYGSASNSTSVFKLGNGSLSLNGSNQYLAADASPDFDFGSGAWGVDFWVRANSVAAGIQPLATYGNSQNDNWQIILDGSTPKFILTENGTAVLTLSSSVAITAGAWWHIAVGKDTDLTGGPYWRLYVRQSGSSGPSASLVSTQTIAPFTGKMAIGTDAQLGGAGFFGGFIDEFHIVKNDCMYVASGGGMQTGVPNVPYGAAIAGLDSDEYVYAGTAGTLPAPLSPSIRYYFRAIGSTGLFQLHLNRGGTSLVNLTNSGTGVHSLFQQGVQSAANLPNDITFDRCLFVSEPSNSMRKLIHLDSRAVNILNSTLDAAHDQSDAQAISGSTAVGPFTFINNWLEGTGENIIFGGSQPGFDTETVGAIIRYNYLPARPERFRWRKWSIGDFAVRAHQLYNWWRYAFVYRSKSGVTQNPEPQWLAMAAALTPEVTALREMLYR
ncbi:MAG: LamG-like jellyroll fold domain-containing protein [Bryobacteraceae bacterium]